jgi:hypothetical protein
LKVGFQRRLTLLFTNRLFTKSRELHLGFFSVSGKRVASLLEEFSMSTAPTASSLFDELATLFATAPSPDAILEFRPSQASIDRANRLLELSRENSLDEASRRELDQFEQAELLMRLVKARIRSNRSKSLPPR